MLAILINCTNKKENQIDIKAIEDEVKLNEIAFGNLSKKIGFKKAGDAKKMSREEVEQSIRLYKERIKHFMN